MNCTNQIPYVIQRGDTLYQLARRYGTTVPMILARNPQINPMNLRIGSTVMLCGDGGDVMPMPAQPQSGKGMELSNAMRLAWEQHVYWTRMLLISIAQRLADEPDVTARLLQNPNDIANIFADYYGADAAKTIAQLLTEHLQIGAQLITALRDGQTEQANKLNFQWYQNADKMADAFAGLNSYFSNEDLRKMLYTHLQLTTTEVAQRLAGDYKADITAFGEVEKEAIAMADYFTDGIMKQYPNRF